MTWTKLWFIFTNLHKKLPIKSWRCLRRSTSGFDCFSITICFGPSLILSGCTEWHSLSTLCIQIYVANIQQTPSSNRADYELPMLIDKGPVSVVWHSRHTLVPPAILAYEITNPIHSSAPVSLPFLLNLEKLVKLEHHLDVAQMPLWRFN